MVIVENFGFLDYLMAIDGKFLVFLDYLMAVDGKFLVFIIEFKTFYIISSKIKVWMGLKTSFLILLKMSRFFQSHWLLLSFHAFSSSQD